jgi:hypothetical protein
MRWTWPLLLTDFGAADCRHISIVSEPVNTIVLFSHTSFELGVSDKPDRGTSVTVVSGSESAASIGVNGSSAGVGIEIREVESEETD